jgi:quercetin dioxygenase-like cupin family protein
MSRAAASTAAVLALLTGLVLGQIGSLATHTDVSRIDETNPSPRTLAVARSFYDGMNRLLASGDRSIETIVAPGFVEHTADGQGDRTLPEMIDWLLATRTTSPRMQMTVLDLEQRDRLIAVRLEVDPGTPVPIPGLPLTTPAPFQALEFLRVEGAAVTDRWNAGAELPVATLRLTFDFNWASTSLVTPAIQRLSLEPGDSIQLALGGPVILRVDSGRVRLDRSGIDLNGIRRPSQEPFGEDQVRIFDGADGLTLRNVSSDPAVLWALSAEGATAAEQAETHDATREPGYSRIVAFIPLQLSSDVLDAPQRISVTRITLPPGTTVAPHDPGVIEEIAVLDGAIDVTVGQGRALMCTDGATAQPFDGTETIAAGEGVSARGAAALGYRVAGPQPATLLIMRIDSFPPGNIPN